MQLRRCKECRKSSPARPGLARPVEALLRRRRHACGGGNGSGWKEGAVEEERRGVEGGMGGWVGWGRGLDVAKNGRGAVGGRERESPCDSSRPRRPTRQPARGRESARRIPERERKRGEGEKEREVVVVGGGGCARGRESACLPPETRVYLGAVVTVVDHPQLDKFTGGTCDKFCFTAFCMK
jgi:hypothetical protein